MNLSKAYKEFEKLMEKIKIFEGISGKLLWDQQTYMPKKGVYILSKENELIESYIHEIITSPRTGRLIEKLESNIENLDDYQRANVREMKRIYERNVKVPTSLVKKMSNATTKGYEIWVRAKKRSDFSEFEPQLEKIIDLKVKYANFIDPDKNPYEVLIEGYEPFVELDDMRRIFSELKRELTPFISKVIDSESIVDKGFLKRTYSTKKQTELCKFLAKKIGYDFDRGRLDETVHPFTSGAGPSDMRITTWFDVHDLRKSIFATIHEAGHGIYEQGILEDQMFTLVGSPRSLGVHESQSRLYENNIGRSKEFWKLFFPKVKETFPRQLRKYNVEDFYEFVNMVKPSFIRVLADELTYNLHILLRFETEDDVINGRMKVKDIPELWNEKMEEYLGIIPKNDRDGALQDVHWSIGYFGYFPTYTIGNVLAAQIFETMNKKIKVREKIREGNFQEIKGWLNKNIHEKGSLYTTDELIKKATGKKLGTNDFLKYVKRKYGEIYGI